MNIGWVGLGKLGLPCALIMARQGHRVCGYDVDTRIKEAVDSRSATDFKYIEPEIPDLLANNERLVVVSEVSEVVANSDVIFVAVQTPHSNMYSGEYPVPEETRDFEYGYLVQAVRSIAIEAEKQRKNVIVVIISTVLPGTTNRVLRPLIGQNGRVKLVYSPLFIAMGTTVHDFQHPEFLLLGGDDREVMNVVDGIYQAVHNARRIYMGIESAELTKVAYNTVISIRLCWVNHLMQLCEGTGADVDEVTNALKHATDRIISTKYMQAGMADSGPCHPRDLIALSNLEERLNAPPFFNSISRLRDKQTGWLADLVKHWSDQSGLPIVILGKTYKPDVSLTVGSAALLLSNILKERNIPHDCWDPLVDTEPTEWGVFDNPSVYIITTKHAQFAADACPYPTGSIIIDPWGYMPEKSGITLVRVGRSLAA